MITFQKIRWKNFLSTGDHWSEINFLGNTTNLVVGTNGSGKSTMLDALTFSLFNKPFRKINKSQLINATNEKDCVVEVEFTVNNKDYLVRRSIKPNKFDIEVNGTLLHKESDDRLNQKILEENILKVNYKSFTQIVILGSSSFVPFMQLSTSNRRDVIEDLLDIRIFSAMNTLIKEKIRTEKEKIRSLDLKRDNIKDKISMQENFIKELEEQGKDNITENQKKRDGLSDEICVLIMQTEDLEDKVYGLTEEQNRERQFNQLSKEITKLNNGISKNNTQISGFQRQIRDLESEVQRFTEQLANRSTENEKLVEFTKSLETTLEESSERREEVIYHDFAYSLLKDDGVKTKIIKKYLPFINQQVNRYLQLMDFYINFTLNEEFVETVRSPIHEDFSYSSFSEGEKMRIDLALLFTWREVARVKNSVNTNLLIMDEIFDSSLDGFGTDEFLKIIRFVIKDANVFVISHKTELYDKFNSVIKFDKVKGFSRIV